MSVLGSTEVSDLKEWELELEDAARLARRRMREAPYAFDYYEADPHEHRSDFMKGNTNAKRTTDINTDDLVGLDTVARRKVYMQRYRAWRKSHPQTHA